MNEVVAAFANAAIAGLYVFRFFSPRPTTRSSPSVQWRSPPKAVARTQYPLPNLGVAHKELLIRFFEANVQLISTHLARVQAIRTLSPSVRARRAPANFPCLLVGPTIFNALCRHLRTGADTAKRGRNPLKEPKRLCMKTLTPSAGRRMYQKPNASAAMLHVRIKVTL